MDLQERTKNSLALAAALYACEECLCADSPMWPLPGTGLVQDRGIEVGRAESCRSRVGEVILRLESLNLQIKRL